MGEAMAELSIIIPFVNEYPQLAFTIRALAEEFIGRVDFEVLAINNFCQEFRNKGMEEDTGAAALRSASEGNPWLKVLSYDASASHWQAKNLGIREAQGDFLLFVDGHVMPGRDSLYPMFKHYQENYRQLNGTLHAPVTYKILEWRKLIYQLNVDLELGKLEYSFASAKEADQPYRIPAMSSCGMMIDRGTMDALGHWPKALGSWGGGENFMNFALATTGRNVWVWHGEPLYHHGEKRGYSMSRNDILHNRCVAVYVVGGRDMARRYMTNAYSSRPEHNSLWREKFWLQVVRGCYEHRQLIKAQQTVSLADWLGQWEGGQDARRVA
jgi:glycosyltransferase involved in cell wall biosynthesis